MIRPLPGLLVSMLFAASIAHAELPPIDIDLPAQDLATSLHAIGRAAGIDIGFESSLVSGKRGPALSGKLSPHDALTKLLTGSGIAFAFTSEKSVAIKAAPVAAKEKMSELSPIEVRSSRPEQEYVALDAVTATKTDTRLIVTPVVVTVIPEQALKDQKVTSLSEALTNSSGVWSYSRGAGCDGNCEAINMRGFQQFGGAMVDGFVAINAGGVTNLSNVERIEVVKGPASVLYGRMEPGGVVNIVTKKPQSVRSASIEQTVGTDSTTVTEFDITGPVDEAKTFLYRLNGSWDRHDLYIKGLKNERQFIAPSLQWNLGARTQALLELTYDKNRYPWQRELYPQDPVTLQPVYFPWSSNITPNSQNTETTEARLGLTHAFNDDWSIKLQARTTRSSNSTDPNSWSIGWMDQLNGEWRIWRTRLDLNGTADNNALQADVTGHFATGGTKHTLLFGADASRQNTFSNEGRSVDAAAFDYFYDITSALNPVAPTASLPVNAWWGTRNHETRRGVYLQDQIELPHNVHLLAGLRYSKVTFDSKDEVSGVWVTDFGADALKIRATRQDSAVTKRLGALWEFRPGSSVYVSYTENFGNYQGAFDFAGNALDPQLAKQKEVGLKQQSADGKWTGSVAIYDLRKTNVQVLDPDHTGCRDAITGFAGTPGVSPCYRAAGLTRARGAEFDLVGELLPGWNVIANYSYNQTRVLKDDLPPATSWVGKSPGYYPQNMAKLATTYRFAGGFLTGWKLGGAITHTGQTDLGNSAPQQTITPGYTLVDLMAAYAFKLGPYKAEAQFNVKNATDKDVQITGSAGFFTTAGRGDPRQVFAKLRVDF